MIADEGSRIGREAVEHPFDNRLSFYSLGACIVGGRSLRASLDARLTSLRQGFGGPPCLQRRRNASLAGLAGACVLAHQRRQRKTQPRIVRGIVIV